jgi:hypothetical protein
MREARIFPLSSNRYTVAMLSRNSFAISAGVAQSVAATSASMALVARNLQLTSTIPYKALSVAVVGQCFGGSGGSGGSGGGSDAGVPVTLKVEAPPSEKWVILVYEGPPGLIGP